MIKLIDTFCIEEYPDYFVPFDIADLEGMQLWKKGKFPNEIPLELKEFIESCGAKYLGNCVYYLKDSDLCEKFQNILGGRLIFDNTEENRNKFHIKTKEDGKQ